MGLTRAAPPPPRSGWDHPTLEHLLEHGPKEGPVAAGGLLTPPTLIGAYRVGAFPWPVDDPDEAAALRRALATAVARGIIPRVPPPPGARRELGAAGGPGDVDPPWWCPDPRTVIPADGIRVNRTLAQRLRTSTWTTTLDRCFVDVVRACRRDGPYQWITEDLVGGYADLHAEGWAHSVEVWDGDDLVGGMYGVLVGRVFMGESMFHRATDASKVAMVDFLERFRRAGGVLLDVQLTTAHLRTLGAQEVPRSDFLAVLRRVRDDVVRMDLDRLPVSRLAPPRRPRPRPGRPPLPDQPSQPDQPSLPDQSPLPGQPGRSEAGSAAPPAPRPAPPSAESAPNPPGDPDPV